MFGRGRVRRDNSYDDDDGHDSLRVDVRMYSVAIPPFLWLQWLLVVYKYFPSKPRKHVRSCDGAHLCSETFKQRQSNGVIG